MGKTSPAKSTSRAPQSPGDPAAVLGHEREDRRGRIPDADPSLGHEIAESTGIFAQVFTDQDQGRRVLAGREEVENRQVEMERGMRGKPVVVGPRAQRALGTNPEK